MKRPERIFYILPIIMAVIVLAGFLLDVPLLTILPWLIFVFALGTAFYFVARAQQ